MYWFYLKRFLKHLEKELLNNESLNYHEYITRYEITAGLIFHEVVASCEKKRVNCWKLDISLMLFIAEAFARRYIHNFWIPSLRHICADLCGNDFSFRTEIVLSILYLNFWRLFIFIGIIYRFIVELKILKRCVRFNFPQDVFLMLVCSILSFADEKMFVAQHSAQYRSISHEFAKKLFLISKVIKRG